MILYLESNTRSYISFAVNQCPMSTHNTKASHENSSNMICMYLQGTKENCLMFNPPKKMVVDCYMNAYFVGLWGHENPQDPICANSSTPFVVNFYYCPLLWVSNI